MGRRLLGTVTAVLLLVGCGAPVPFGEQPVVADHPADPFDTTDADAEDVPFEVLGAAADVDVPSGVDVVAEADRLAATWAALDLGPPPSVDLDRHVVVVYEVEGTSTCRDELTALRLADGVLDGIWEPATGDCPADQVSHAVVVAVERAALPRTFAVRGHPQGAGTGLVDVDLDAPAEG
jgi:hypothetical protein